MKKTKLLALLCAVALLCATLLSPLVSAEEAPASEPAAPEAIAWPGGDEVTVFDATPTFTDDASGLDIYNNQLYAVDNGDGKIWVMDIAADGTLTLADGYAEGRQVFFPGCSDKSLVKHEYYPTPDAEAITVDGDGCILLGSERGIVWGEKYARNVVLRADPRTEGPLEATMTWDLTAALPTCEINKGIEGIEWVASADVEGKLFDENTQQPYQADTYPDAMPGVVFVALETGGHVYAFVFYDDGTFDRIADIDPGLGTAMALDYDTQEQVLWVMCDDHKENLGAQLTFNGTAQPDVVHVAPPAGVATDRNTEGFAIGAVLEGDSSHRAVYRFCDSVEVAALTIGTLNADYHAAPTPTPVFEDVEADSFYAQAVAWAAEKKITAGKTNTTFDPKGSCTRAQAVTFLWRAAGKPEPTTTTNPFTDVEADSYYEKAVLWAVEKGITNGTSDTIFAPNATCNRAQAVTFLWRAAEKPEPKTAETSFTDVKADSFYEKAVLWAVENGVTNGKSATTFVPEETCNRAQIVTFLWRADSLLAD